MGKFYQNSFLACGWAVTLLGLIILALFGRTFQKTLVGYIGRWGVGLLIGSVVVLLLGSVVFYAIKNKRWIIIVHIVWIGGLLAWLMHYLGGNPERWLHIPLFGLLAFLSAKLFSLRTGAEIALSYAFLDELIQHYVPDRHGTFEDIQINLTCALIGLFIYWLNNQANKNYDKV